MKTLSFLLFLFMVASASMAAPEPKLTSAVCRADLKAWSASKTEMLTIEQINERMNTMVACADEAHHHHHSDKKVLAYIAEFYRVHAELGNRTFDFITRHGLKAQFDEEENGVSNPISEPNKSDENAEPLDALSRNVKGHYNIVWTDGDSPCDAQGISMKRGPEWASVLR